MGWKNRLRKRKNGEQRPDAQRAVDDHVPTDGQKRCLAQHPDHLGARSVDRVDLCGVVVGRPVVPDHVAVMHDVVPLAVVRGDDADPVKALGEVGQDVGDPVAPRSYPAPTLVGTTGSGRW